MYKRQVYTPTLNYSGTEFFSYTIRESGSQLTATALITVTVVKAPSSNADPASLALSSGPLTPAFISTTTSYTAAVDNLTTSVMVTPTLNDANATLSVNGAPLASGEPYTLTPLTVGPNVRSTTVTAEDGATQQTYVITVTRLGADGDWYADPVGDNANSCRAPGVGYACQTIIGAMDKAASGNRIFIAAATYTESLVVTKSLQFIGVGGPTVSGGGTNRVFSVTTGVDVTMDGLTVTGGWLSGSTPANRAGAGIYSRGALTLTNMGITNKLASSAFASTGGGGIYNTGDLRPLDVAISDHKARPAPVPYKHLTLPPSGLV